MPKLSWRHHYLPVFYLKGFTKESGKLKIYDVKKRRFIKNGKEFSPESYFFEKDSNTITFNGLSSDLLETRHYSSFDGKISTLIKKITSGSHTDRFGVDEDDMPVLNFFASLMYWRLPHRKDELNSIIQNHSLNELGLSINNRDGSKNVAIEEKFKNEPEFLKSYKFYNSLMDSLRGVNCRTPYTILSNSEQLPYLCSDNPIIFEKSDFPKVYEDDYLFPLSGNRLFVKTNRRNNFPSYLRLMVDTIIFKQAVKYVSCTDERYIYALEKNFEKYKVSLEEYKTALFKRINMDIQ